MLPPPLTSQDSHSPPLASPAHTLPSCPHTRTCVPAVGGGDSARSANPNKANALYSILFEAIALAIHLDTDRVLLNTCVSVLGKFLATKVRVRLWSWGWGWG